MPKEERELWQLREGTRQGDWSRARTLPLYSRFTFMNLAIPLFQLHIKPHQSHSRLKRLSRRTRAACSTVSAGSRLLFLCSTELPHMEDAHTEVAKTITTLTPTGGGPGPQGINDGAIHAALGRDSLPVLRIQNPLKARTNQNKHLWPGFLNPPMRESFIGTHSCSRVHHQQLSNLDRLVSKCRDAQSITRTSQINPMKHLQETKSLAAAETGVHSCGRTQGNPLHADTCISVQPHLPCRTFQT